MEDAKCDNSNSTDEEKANEINAALLLIQGLTCSKEEAIATVREHHKIILNSCKVTSAHLIGVHSGYAVFHMLIGELLLAPVRQPLEMIDTLNTSIKMILDKFGWSGNNVKDLIEQLEAACKR